MDIKIKMGGEEKEESRIDEWDMPVSLESGKNQSAAPGIQNEKSQNSNISALKNSNTPHLHQDFGRQAKFKDARPIIREVTVPVNFQKALYYWKSASRWSLILLAALAPIFFLPFTSLPVAANKEILVFILILVSLFASLGRILIEGRIRYPGHPITASLTFLVLVWGASAFFSVNRIGSLTGGWSAPDSFASILLFAVLALSAAMTFDRRDIVISLLIFVSSLSVLGIFELLQLAKLFVLPFDFAKNAAFNPVGSTNNLGVLLAFGLVIVSGMFSATETSKMLKNFLGFSAVVFILNLIAVDFWAIWTGLALAMILMISFLSTGLSGSGLTRAETDRNENGNFPRESSEYPHESASNEYQGLQLAYFQKAWLPSVILLVSLFFIFAPSPFARFVQTPGEVSLNFRATTNIALANLKAGNYFLGSGPNTFGYVYSLYKPVVINQTILWSTVFGSGASAFLSWAATAGILGILAILFLIAVFVYKGFAANAGNFSAGMINSASRSVFAAVLFMFAMWFFYSANFTVTAFTFWGIGLFFAASRFLEMDQRGLNAEQRGNYRVESTFNRRDSAYASKEFQIFTSPAKTFLFSLIIVGLMVSAAAGVYFEINRYIAEIYFGRAITASNQNNGETINNLSKAINFWPYDERYFEAMSQAVFLQINDLFSKKDLPQEVLRSQFQNFTSNSIAYAQRARDLNPKNQFNSALLGNIYENLIPFTADAAGFALSSYEEAAALDPKNPGDRLAMARVQIAQANSAASKKAGAVEINGYLDKALANLEEAISLKSDYAPARFLEVQIFDRRGKLTDAVKRAEELVVLNNSDVGVLFQLGFLYYKAERFEESRQVLERTISLSPNYSNARYFLGLIYDKNGTRDSAVEQFSKIAELNPDNNEVKQILVNIKSKKPALYNIAPPLPAPQNRAEAPVSEGAKAPVQKLRK